MGLTLTDASGSDRARSICWDLQAELTSRWSLLEAAFAPGYDPASLGTDGEEIYVARYLERIGITHVRPVIGGIPERLLLLLR
jgi:hypothetical protein